MGLFSVPITISGPDGGRSATVAALVDTGASHSMAPSDMRDNGYKVAMAANLVARAVGNLLSNAG